MRHAAELKRRQQMNPMPPPATPPLSSQPGTGPQPVMPSPAAISSSSSSGPIAQNPPIYPPNAALQAIRRFSARPPFPELMVTTFLFIITYCFFTVHTQLVCLLFIEIYF